MLTIYFKGIEPFGMEAYTLDNQNYKMVKGQGHLKIRAMLRFFKILLSLKKRYLNKLRRYIYNIFFHLIRTKLLET